MERKDGDKTNTECTYITIEEDILLVFVRKDKAIKVVFDKEIHPSKLKEVLNQSCNKLQKLRSKKLISNEQWDLLFPKAGCKPVSSNTFDSSLMLCLLNNLTDVQIYDEIPFQTDHSINADLSRLRFFRNLMCHIPADGCPTPIPTLAECKQAIIRLTGGDWKDFKIKIIGNGSKDSNVFMKSCLRFYRKECNLKRIGLFSASWELTLVDKIKKTEEVLCFCVQYKLFELVVSNLWNYLTEGMQWNVNVQFLNETVYRNIKDEVPSCEHFRTRYGTHWTISDKFRDSDRRNYCNQQIPWADITTIHEGKRHCVPLPKAFRFVETTSDAYYEVERCGFRKAEYGYELIGHENNTNVFHQLLSCTEDVTLFNYDTKRQYDWVKCKDIPYDKIICGTSNINETGVICNAISGPVHYSINYLASCHDTANIVNSSDETSWKSNASSGNSFELNAGNRTSLSTGAKNYSDTGYCMIM